ncbi:hypothetical protein [Bifidobacterium xylocopae]|uniref:Uncharacterized protein n=1 Tax=Bifidobacterium xylocopae TaxID=2493119 RepID=A0A366KBB8_9BIFI|nr:hypothetical protein [Bifidobacterium xylocopae]RBP99020.1 hypothetical protein CRD59_05995 [Bifidobacterium xylocopae]
MGLKKTLRAVGVGILACTLLLAMIVGLRPVRAWAGNGQPQDGILTVQVKLNGDGENIIPQTPQPAGSGYIYSATKLDYNAMQRIINGVSGNDEHARTKAITDQVMGQMSSTIDRTNGNTTIYFGTTDGDGQITVGNGVREGVWLQGANYDQSQNKVTGGTPATFLVSTGTYWAIQLVSGPTGKIARGDPMVLRVPTKDSDGTLHFDVKYEPKITVKDVPAEPAPAEPAEPAVPAGCPECIPSGNLAATGSSIVSPLVAVTLLLAVAIPMTYMSRNRR